MQTVFIRTLTDASSVTAKDRRQSQCESRGSWLSYGQFARWVCTPELLKRVSQPPVLTSRDPRVHSVSGRYADH